MLPYERQLEEKEEQVARRADAASAGFEDPPVEPIVPAIEQLRYRNKLEYSFGTDDGGELVLGFHRPGRWDLIDDVADDILASERDQRAARGREGVVPRGGPRPRGTARPARACCATSSCARAAAPARSRPGSSRARASTFRVAELAAATPADGFLWTPRRRLAETTRGGETAAGQGRSSASRRSWPACASGSRPDAFFQTNTEMAERLYGIGRRAGRPERPRAGARPVLRHRHDRAVARARRAARSGESSSSRRRSRDAIENARLNGIDNAKFFAGDVRLAMRELLEQSGRPDVVVVDPPRAGLSQKVVRRIIEAEAQRIVYVSCNPTTLAPERAPARGRAATSSKTVRPVDMFPQTPHIECVALLERS